MKTRHPLPVVPDAPVDLAPDLRERDVDPERRAFLRTAAAGAALASLAGCGGVTMEEFFRKHFKEPDARTAEAGAGQRGGEEQGEVRARHHGDGRGAARRGGVRLRPRSLPVHRLPPLRLRLRQGEQPVARPSAVPVDSRAGDGQGARRRPLPRRAVLRAGHRPAARQVLLPGPVPALPQPAVREGLPDPGDLEGEGRDRRRRLRLVHRLPLLHGGLPVRGPPLQLRGGEPARGRAQPRPALPRQPAAPEGVVDKCTFCIQRSRNGRYPACLEACPVGARKCRARYFLDPHRAGLEAGRISPLRVRWVQKVHFSTTPLGPADCRGSAGWD